MTESLLTERISAFEENYKIISDKIAESALRSGRSVEEITLLAATKTVPAEVINHAVLCGIRTIGENRVQELLDKYETLDKEHCDIQFIGRLQTNKVSFLVDKVSCIQSVDSVKLAKEISRIYLNAGERAHVLVEVNVGEQESKGGVRPEKLLEFIDEIRELAGLHIDGLMAIPPICENKPELCRYFSLMRQYFVDIRAKKLDNVSMDCLSMGMSDDFPEAIECGATMVRVGSSLFGKR